MSDPLRVAFVGAGNMNTQHMSNVAAIDGAAVTAVCDVDAGRAREAADEYDAAAYTDHAEMLPGDYDAVYVAVPPFAHTDQERRALEGGADLFVEKPLALDRETARENLAAIEEHDAVTQVGHVLRYDDLTDRALELVGDRQLALVDGQYWGGVPPVSWWVEREKSGGQVVEQATHVYDLVRLFAGEVDEVSAAGDRTVVGDIDFPDATSATMHHEGGTVSTVSATAAAPEGRCVVHLVGDDLRLRVAYFEGRLSGTVDGESVAAESSGQRLREEDREFLAAVREGDPDRPRSPYADAIETFGLTLDVTDAIDG